jgi:hypothetical protein
MAIKASQDDEMGSTCCLGLKIPTRLDIPKPAFIKETNCEGQVIEVSKETDTYIIYVNQGCQNEITILRAKNMQQIKT